MTDMFYYFPCDIFIGSGTNGIGILKTAGILGN